jgi:Mannosyltransferase (PIG-V)
VSASTPLPQTSRSRPLRFEDLLAPGTAAVASVAFAGFTLGFFAWFTLVVPRHDPVLSNLALIVAVILGPLLAVGLWFGYAAYFSRRAGVTHSRSLQYDALTWLPFWLLWLTFFLPPQFVHGARIFLVAVALFCVAKVFIAARFNQTVREVLIDFVATRAAIFVIAELAAATIGQRPGEHVQESNSVLLAVWGRWDAVHYLDIAAKGYQGFDMAFFPLYPMLVRIVGGLAGNHLVGGLLISNAAFFFGLLYLYKLLEHEYDRGVARRGIFYISVFPTAFFFSAVYSESLFFMLTVASFYYMRAHRWWMAGAVGFFASLTRVEGILLVVPFAIEWLASSWPVLRRGDRERTVALVNLAPVGLIVGGLLVYMAYLWVLRADPLYFSHVQVHWNRHFAMPWVSVHNAFHKIAIAMKTASAASGQTIAGQLLELSATFLMIGVLAFGFLKLRPSYIAYMALSILAPMCTSSLMSMPRFALVLFPMFAILARWGERPWVNNVILAFSLPLLGLFTVLFADWYWVA